MIVGLFQQQSKIEFGVWRKLSWCVDRNFNKNIFACWFQAPNPLLQCSVLICMMKTLLIKTLQTSIGSLQPVSKFIFPFVLSACFYPTPSQMSPDLHAVKLSWKMWGGKLLSKKCVPSNFLTKKPFRVWDGVVGADKQTHLHPYWFYLSHRTTSPISINTNLHGINAFSLGAGYSNKPASFFLHEKNKKNKVKSKLRLLSPTTSLISVT